MIYTDQPVIYDRPVIYDKPVVYYFTLPNARLFYCLTLDYLVLAHQGESAATQIRNGLKNIETKCLAEAAKLFIGVWCNTDISFICKDRAGELLVHGTVLQFFDNLP
jgi:hypothetical protein